MDGLERAVETVLHETEADITFGQTELQTEI